MFGALALMPLDRLDECLTIIKSKTSLLTGKSVNEFIVYFEKTWINGNWPQKIWNYFEYIGHKTNNDLKNFNKLGKKDLDHKISFINNKITIAD